jgi:hypothetical protein
MIGLRMNSSRRPVPGLIRWLRRVATISPILLTLVSCSSMQFGNSDVSSTLAQLLGIAILVWLALLIV